MGNAKSNMRRNASTPTMTSGRLAIRESPTISNTPGIVRIRSLNALVNDGNAIGETTYLLPKQQTVIPPAQVGKFEAVTTNGNGTTADAVAAAPALIAWICPALLCALAYALYNVFIKKGSDSIHPVMGGVILQIVAALLGTLLLALIAWNDGGMEELLDFDSSGIFWSILAGCAVGVAEMLSFFVMGMGVQAMQAVPIIIGGSVMFGTVLGYLWLHEVLSYQGWSGVLLLVLGITMVATDPGAVMVG